MMRPYLIPTLRQDETRVTVKMVDITLYMEVVGVEGIMTVEVVDKNSPEYGKTGQVRIQGFVLNDKYMREIIYDGSFDVWYTDVEWE